MLSFTAMNTKRLLILTPLLMFFCLLPTFAQEGTRLEAEDASYTNCKLVTGNQYSGKKALELTEGNASITFSYTASECGKYDVYVGYDALYGAKMVNLSVNGNSISFQVNGQKESPVGTFIMNEGTNTAIITPNWTWFRIDYIRIERNTESLPFNIPEHPVDSLATDAALEMYAFLCDNFGKKTISGMMTGDMTTANGNVTRHADIQAVYKVSGKYPALVGFDFMNATGLYESDSWSKSYTSAAMNLARDTYRRGGFPNFTWHWRDPSRKTDAFYSSDCSVKVSDAFNDDGSWNTSSALYKNIIADIDVISDHFLALQKANIACIFRPLHEASGGWFWWGREGAPSFVKLYRLLFDEMVNVKGVHNVIWVWNAGENDDEWNPGNDYYDVVSADIYNEAFDYSSNYATFEKLKSLTEGKRIIALSENGPIPDIDKEFDEDAVWSWWMPWYQTWDGNFVNKTSSEEWTKCMNDSRVVTLDDLSAGWGQTAISLPESEHDDSHILYDLLGRRITTVPGKGIYVKGDKKLLVP